jgi:hypothetical protein
MPPSAKLSTKGWVLEELIAQNSNFRRVPRVKWDAPELLTVIEAHESAGEPLVVEGWHEHSQWPKETFTIEWLLDNFSHGTHYIGDWDPCILTWMLLRNESP